ncbi:MAG: dTDP-4-dehydrorhamnose 3,5-epimerase [Phycisphaeraceae bacterium]|nr:dTDP-4-dehydrorhamnose 3,5-epimerase [Phycisphaeraceae bacterium]
MRFTATDIAGAFVIDLDPIADERGWFARSFCQDELRQRGLDPCIVQCNISFNRHKGTLRGMHYQAAPHAETKIVRVVRGAIYDVAVDLRPDSPSCRRWHAVELSGDNRRAFYIPAGCAHGFLTLTDDAEVHYLMSAPYHAPSARGVRWNDPAFGIAWPAPVLAMSDRDRSYPDFPS